MEIRYFGLGSATTYTGFEGHQITCSGGTLMVDGEEIHHMVMHVTEEVLYRDEKFISRDDEDGVIAHYDNVRLSCPIEDKHWWRYNEFGIFRTCTRDSFLLRDKGLSGDVFF